MTAKPAPKMMEGSSSSASYFAFARKGKIALGIKPYGILKGAAFGVEDCTYFVARLRSAPAGGLFAEENLQTVVTLQKTPATLWDAWEKVEWEKKDANRASTSIGIFLRGKFGKDVSLLKKLLEGFENGAMTNKMADYLIDLAGVQSLIVSKRELQTWLEGQYKPMVDKIVADIKKSTELTNEIEQQVGVFGMQAALLKKVYGQTEQIKAEDLDEQVPDMTAQEEEAEHENEE